MLACQLYSDFFCHANLIWAWRRENRNENAIIDNFQFELKSNSLWKLITSMFWLGTTVAALFFLALTMIIYFMTKTLLEKFYRNYGQQCIIKLMFKSTFEWHLMHESSKSSCATRNKCEALWRIKASIASEVTFITGKILCSSFSILEVFYIMKRKKKIDDDFELLIHVFIKILKYAELCFGWLSTKESSWCCLAMHSGRFSIAKLFTRTFLSRASVT